MKNKRKKKRKKEELGECFVCGQIFSDFTPTEKNDHLNSCLSNKNPLNNLQCPLCQKRLPSKKEHEKHVRKCADQREKKKRRKKKKKKDVVMKKCILCKELIINKDYKGHLRLCSKKRNINTDEANKLISKTSSSSTLRKNRKRKREHDNNNQDSKENRKRKRRKLNDPKKSPVSGFLSRVGMSRYRDDFRVNGISTGKNIIRLDDDGLKLLEIKKNHRKKIMKEIEKWKDEFTTDEEEEENDDYDEEDDDDDEEEEEEEELVSSGYSQATPKSSVRYPESKISERTTFDVFDNFGIDSKVDEDEDEILKEGGLNRIEKGRATRRSIFTDHLFESENSLESDVNKELSSKKDDGENENIRRKLSEEHIKLKVRVRSDIEKIRKKYEKDIESLNSNAKIVGGKGFPINVGLFGYNVGDNCRIAAPPALMNPLNPPETAEFSNQATPQVKEIGIQVDENSFRENQVQDLFDDVKTSDVGERGKDDQTIEENEVIEIEDDIFNVPDDLGQGSYSSDTTDFIPMTQTFDYHPNDSDDRMPDYGSWKEGKLRKKYVDVISKKRAPKEEMVRALEKYWRIINNL